MGDVRSVPGAGGAASWNVRVVLCLGMCVWCCVEVCVVVCVVVCGVLFFYFSPCFKGSCLFSFDKHR